VVDKENQKVIFIIPDIHIYNYLPIMQKINNLVY
jgi:hypothetical protein